MTVRPGFILALVLTLALALWIQVPQAYQDATTKRQPSYPNQAHMVDDLAIQAQAKPLSPFLSWLFDLTQAQGLAIEEIRQEGDVDAYRLIISGPDQALLGFYTAFENENRAEVLRAVWTQADAEGLGLMRLEVRVR